MFASMVALHVAPEQLDEAVRRFQEAAETYLPSEPGYVGGYLLTHRDSGKVTVFALWQDENSARAYGASGRLAQHFSQFLQLSDTTFNREIFEVSVQIRNP